jgi:hypothetical protein
VVDYYSSGRDGLAYDPKLDEINQIKTPPRTRGEKLIVKTTHLLVECIEFNE